MEEMFEIMIHDFLRKGYAVMDEFIPDEVVCRLNKSLLRRLDRDQMQESNIGQPGSFQRDPDIRRDLISWIDEGEANHTEKYYLDHVSDFTKHFNQVCNTGLHAIESHYAWFGQGSFYKRHLDRFQTDVGRKFSLVTYLNTSWPEGTGGELVLYIDNKEIKISPYGGRAVFFQSNIIEHEVLPSYKPRLSIAGWLK